MATDKPTKVTMEHVKTGTTVAVRKDGKVHKRIKSRSGWSEAKAAGSQGS